MSDIAPMPEGLTTPEIPLSSKIDELLSINTGIWNTTEESLENDKRANSIQTRLLTNIYTKLSSTLQVELDEESKEDLDIEQSSRASFRKDLTTQFQKLNRNIEGVVSSALIYSQPLEDMSINELERNTQEQLLSNLDYQLKSFSTDISEAIVSPLIAPTVEPFEDSAKVLQEKPTAETLGKYMIPLLDILDSQLTKLNTNIETIINNPLVTETIINNPLVTETTILPKDKPIKDRPTEDKQSPEEEKKQNKFFEGLNAQFEKFSSKVEGVTSNLYDNFMPALLGPLNLLAQPLSELTGINPLESLKTGFKGLFGKKASKKPSAEAVAKGGFIGAGFLYMTNMMEKWFKKGEDGEGLKGKLGGLASLLGGKLPLGGLVKGLGIGAIVSSVVLMVIDGIKGAKMSDIWGTSKVSSVIGGVLGGVDKGLKGMFKGMGKWALMGAGIGTLIAPGIGTLIGGLIGGAFGGIAGWIGGEKIAKIMDKFGGFFKDIFGDISSRIKESFNTLVNFDFKGAIGESGGVIPFILEYTPKVMKYIFDSVSGVFDTIDNSALVSDLKAKFPILEKIGNIAQKFFEPFIEAWKTIFSELDFSEIWKSDASLGSKIGLTLRDIAFAWLEGLKTMFSSIGENFTESLVSMIGGSEGIIGGAKGLLGGAKDNFSDFIGGLLGKDSTNVDDAIITKDGQIIHTNQDDNIIATKNDPTQIMMDSKVETTREVVKMPEMNNFNSVSIDNSEMLEIFKEMRDILKSKDMSNNTIIPSNTGVDMKSLRMLGVSQ